MKSFFRLGILVSIAMAFSSVEASFHQWRITEFFSNTDGSVQFIELYVPANNEHVAANAQIRSNSSPLTPFTFPANLSTSLTAGKRLLIATSTFASLPGAITPDYNTLPANFFSPTSDTVRLYAPGHGEFHSRTINASTLVPTDGIMSRHYTPPTYPTSLAANMPTNFAGATGSINLSIPPNNGDYNGDLVVNAADYTVWRNTFGIGVTQGSGADGNNSRTIDVGDYTFWKSRYGTLIEGSGAGQGGNLQVPEPSNLSTMLAALGLLFIRRNRPRLPPLTVRRHCLPVFQRFKFANG
jgi:hypothetical protein